MLVYDTQSSCFRYETCVSVCLIRADVGNINTRISRFANYLRNLLPSNDTDVMELAAKTVGKLALVYGTYIAEYVEFEVKRAFEWLGGDRHEGKRYAAVRYAMCGQNCELMC
jgi:FKBP12-rapamycin complex-associated protein